MAALPPSLPLPPSQECFPWLEPSLNAQENSQPLLYQQVDLNLEDLFSDTLPPVPLSLHLVGGRVLGRAFHHQTLGGLTHQDVLGPDPGHQPRTL